MIVWHRGEVLQLLWKLIHKVLPLVKTMQHRFPSISPICVNWGTHEEDAIHLLHQSQFERACFLAGPPGLMTDTLNKSITQALQGMSDTLDDEQWLTYVNSTWALWHCRNDKNLWRQAIRIHSVQVLSLFN